MRNENKFVAHDKNHLTTVGELNPLVVIEQFGSSPIVMSVLAVWSRNSETGLLEEKGEWVHRCWHSTLESIPGIQGARLLWNTLFFVTTGDVSLVKEQFQEILRRMNDLSLKSFCVICESQGTPQDKLMILDQMQSQIASSRNFFDSNFCHKLRDGEEETI